MAGTFWTVRDGVVGTACRNQRREEVNFRPAFVYFGPDTDNRQGHHHYDTVSFSPAKGVQAEKLDVFPIRWEEGRQQINSRKIPYELRERFADGIWAYLSYKFLPPTIEVEGLIFWEVEVMGQTLRSNVLVDGMYTYFPHRYELRFTPNTERVLAPVWEGAFAIGRLRKAKQKALETQYGVVGDQLQIYSYVDDVMDYFQTRRYLRRWVCLGKCEDEARAALIRRCDPRFLSNQRILSREDFFVVAKEAIMANLKLYEAIRAEKRRLR